MRFSRPNRWLVVTIALLASAAGAGSQQPAPAAAPACASAAYHYFDFWIGSWTVESPPGKAAGTNRIEPILGGCALQEHWRSARGSAGTSFSSYDASADRWHQTWVDDEGTLLLLDGGLRDGAMVLSGRTAAPNGGSVQHRVAWTRLDASGDRVRQLWESSKDGGATWSVEFDGTYTRRR